VDEKALTPQLINPIVQRRSAMSGLELEAFSAQGTARRITDRGGAARRGIALLEAMQHRGRARARQGSKAGALAGVYGFR
jgi:hypothetical protein